MIIPILKPIQFIENAPRSRLSELLSKFQLNNFIWLVSAIILGQRFNLSFLELVIYISVIAGFTQILELAIDKFSPSLYAALGVFLPLLAVNCAGLGWWLAIALVAMTFMSLTGINLDTSKKKESPPMILNTGKKLNP